MYGCLEDTGGGAETATARVPDAAVLFGWLYIVPAVGLAAEAIDQRLNIQELETMAQAIQQQTPDSTSSRHEKSLGLLTTKFVTLLQEAKDGVLDLKVVSSQFGVNAFCAVQAHALVKIHGAENLKLKSILTVQFKEMSMQRMKQVGFVMMKEY